MAKFKGRSVKLNKPFSLDLTNFKNNSYIDTITFDLIIKVDKSKTPSIMHIFIKNSTYS